MLAGTGRARVAIAGVLVLLGLLQTSGPQRHVVRAYERISVLAEPFDPDAVRLLSATPIDRQQRLLGAFAIDCDHDGDLDVVAATADELLIVWINDGHGSLRRQMSRPASTEVAATRLTAHAAGSAFTVPLTTPDWLGMPDEHAVPAADVAAQNLHPPASSFAPLAGVMLAGASRAPPSRVI